MIDNKSLRKALEQVLSGKGSRKFEQSVELAINFRGIDFNKPENRLNLEIPLPKGKGRESKIAVFADGQLASEAKAAGADAVLGGDMIEKLAKDKPTLKKYVVDYTFLAEPKLMVVIGKHLGQVLGARGKMPKPLMGKNLQELMERTRRTVALKSKGKYMPVVHVAVGTEKMAPEDLLENIAAVIDTVKAKVGEAGIKNVYLKLTMGAPVKVS